MPEHCRILIVEDEEGLALHLRILLQRMQHIPLEPVAYGEAAVTQAEALKPDLVLMDINLAGQMDGIEAAGLIRERFGIPVIFVTAMGGDDILEQATNSMPYGYLLKPVKESDLRAAIHIALYTHRMEAQLRKSEQRFRLLFDKMTNGLALHQVTLDDAGSPSDCRFLAINPAYEQMFGVKAAEVAGRTLREALPGRSPGFYQDYIETYGVVAVTGQPVHCEQFIPETDRHYNMMAYSPEPGQFAIIVEDISERKHAEEALKESENRFRQLAEGVREVFWLRARDTGQMLYVSPSYERLFGHPREDLMRDPQAFTNVILEEDRPAVLQAMKALQQDGTPFSEEYRICHSDGSTHWIWARTFPVVGEGGLVTRYSGIAEDITERKQAEENLRSTNRRIEQNIKRLLVLRQIDQAIITHTDLPTMIRTVLTQMTGLSGIDACTAFVPRKPGIATGSLSRLRLVGAVGLPEEFFAGPVLDWMLSVSNDVYQSCEPHYLWDMHEEKHTGVTALNQQGLNGCVTLPLIARGQVKGVLQFLRRRGAELDGEWKDFLQSLALQTAIAIDTVEMFEHLRQSNIELTLAYEETIKGWGRALEMRDIETQGHSERVTRLTRELAQVMGLHEPDLTHIQHGALLHDVGKMAVPDGILFKTASLTPDEWITMRKHPKIAYENLNTIEYLRPALEVVYAHHEKWDGSGYPRSLKGESIPLSARIFAVVDVWDALTSNRPYRLAWSHEEARDYIIHQAGTHFDPRVVDAFLKIVD